MLFFVDEVGVGVVKLVGNWQNCFSGIAEKKS
jgi:hypothetical protein